MSFPKSYDLYILIYVLNRIHFSKTGFKIHISTKGEIRFHLIKKIKDIKR